MKSIKYRVWNTREKKYHLPFKSCSTTYNLSYYENTKHVKYPEEFISLTLEDQMVFVGDIVYIAGVGNCEVKFSDETLGFIFVSLGTETEWNYQDVIEDIERVVGNVNEGVING